MKKPEISIILINYNNHDYIADAIRSVKKQTFQDFECIIIDDGSSDNSRDIIKEYTDQDKRFKLIFQENKGASNARNTGLRAVRGNYIIFLDSDDCYTPISLEALHRVAINENADIVGGDTFAVHDSFKLNDDDYKFNTLLSEIKPFFSSGKEPLVEIRKLYEHNRLLMDSYKIVWIWRQLFKADLLKDKYFDEDLFPGEDLLFSILVYRDVKKICLIDYPVIYHRISKTSSVNIKMTEANVSYFPKTLHKLIDLLKTGYPYQFVDFVLISFANLLFDSMIMATFKRPDFRQIVARELKTIINTPELLTRLSKLKLIIMRLFIRSFAPKDK